MNIKRKIIRAIFVTYDRYWIGLRRLARNLYYQYVLGAMGNDCQVAENVKIFNPSRVILGHHVFLNDEVLIQACDDASVTIGNFVTLSYGSYIITGGLELPVQIKPSYGVHIARPVKLGNFVWVGARAVILPGITVGEHAVIAAGAVVTKDVAPGTVVAGVPAKFIRTLNLNKEVKNGKK